MIDARRAASRAIAMRRSSVWSAAATSVLIMPLDASLLAHEPSAGGRRQHSAISTKASTQFRVAGRHADLPILAKSLPPEYRPAADFAAAIGCGGALASALAFSASAARYHQLINRHRCLGVAMPYSSSSRYAEMISEALPERRGRRGGLRDGPDLGIERASMILLSIINAHYRSASLGPYCRQRCSRRATRRVRRASHRVMAGLSCRVAQNGAARIATPITINKFATNEASLRADGSLRHHRRRPRSMIIGSKSTPPRGGRRAVIISAMPHVVSACLLHRRCQAEQ